MCEYCENEKTIFEENQISQGMIQWCGEIKSSDLPNFEYRQGLFIDNRGYLRLVDLDDCNCLEAGEKVEIKYCPFCGKKVAQSC